MKPILYFVLLMSCFAASPSRAQIKPDLGLIADPAIWRVHNRAVSSLTDRPTAVRLDARDGDGVAWLMGSDFSEGTIEIDLRGANQPGRSFIGIAFRRVDDETFDAIYFRPFNFENPDVVRRGRSIQYISQPTHPWEKLRAESPGRYEAAPSPVPDPDGWFHVRIVIEKSRASVYVDDAAEPSLEVDLLSDGRGGPIGLWVGNGSAGDFGNLVITSLP